MSKHALLLTLKRYETSISDSERAHVNLKQVANDVNRVHFHFTSLGKNMFALKTLRKILYNVFVPSSVEFVQGMSDIVAFLAYAYFSERIQSYISEKNKVELIEGQDISIESFTAAENDEIDQFIGNNSEIMEKLRASSANILREKFLVFIKNDFKLFKRYEAIFFRMLEESGIRIPEPDSINILCPVLTFFTRETMSDEVIYKIFNIILNSEPAIVFPILKVFFKNIRDNRQVASNEIPNPILDVTEKNLDDIEIQYRIFNRMLRQSNGGGIQKHKYTLICAAVGVVAVCVAAVATKSKKG